MRRAVKDTFATERIQTADPEDDIEIRRKVFAGGTVWPNLEVEDEAAVVDSERRYVGPAGDRYSSTYRDRQVADKNDVEEVEVESADPEDSVVIRRKLPANEAAKAKQLEMDNATKASLKDTEKRADARPDHTESTGESV